MSPSDAAAGADGAPLVPRRASRRAGLSIQSTVLIMLLVVSLTSNVLVGLIGYNNAADSLRDAAFDRLVEVRDSREREIERLFSTLESTIVVHASGQSVVEATQSFTEGFAELGGVDLTEQQLDQLEGYYDGVVGPRLASAGAEVDARDKVCALVCFVGSCCSTLTEVKHSVSFCVCFIAIIQDYFGHTTLHFINGFREISRLSQN